MTIASTSLSFQPSLTWQQPHHQPKEGTLSPTVEAFHSTSTSSQASFPSKKRQYHLVLVGGGHAHVQVVKALACRPEYLKVTLIDRQTTATYSGMVPGCIADLYDPKETKIDIQRLAQQYAKIEFVHDAVVDIDCNHKYLYLQNTHQKISFDVLSLDIGSTVRDLDSVDGAREYTIPTRPIDKLVERLRDEMTSDETNDPGIVVVGGGVAGIELSMAMSARYRTAATKAYKTTLLDAGDELLPHESDTARTAVLNLLDKKGVRIQHNCQVCRIDNETIYMTDGRTVPYRHCIWATGAGSHCIARKLQNTPGQISCDKRGWFVVKPTLQSTSHPYIFAAGDCATIVDPENPQRPSPPKAGVYAVRSGPILTENLTRYVEYLRQRDAPKEETFTNEQQYSALELQRLSPQDDFLKLLVCGDGCALGMRFGTTIQGRWVFELKDDIDRSFMDLFDVSKLPPPPKAFTGSYDTSQYDATNDDHSSGLSAIEASALLQRTDNQVDFRVARRVLRQMGQDEGYRRAVLAEMKCGVAPLAW